MNNYSYQLGGSLPINALSYVRRKTDKKLFQALKERQFCYLLNCRQMGKSSLAIKIRQQLRDEGIACDIISLDKVGSSSTTLEQWYGGMIRSLISSFMPSESFDLRSWLQENSFLSPVMRLSEFIEKVLLKKVTQSIVIFYDEVDSILSLKFNHDDFFALLRYFYNQRAINPEFNRLTFAFLGVASPSDLIQDSTKTPFNIGKRIELQGFKLEEIEPLMEGLKEKAANPQAVMKEILFWTNGQPFLTQKLCKIISESENIIISGNEKHQLENLAKLKIIENWESQDNPQHLRTIQDRILGDVNNNINLLEYYRQILEKESILVNSIEAEVLLKLRLSGLVIQQQNQVKVYNEIYKLVFNREWIDNQLEKIRPYALSINAWFASDCKDKSQLLRGEVLQNALEWSTNRHLSQRDNQYLYASQYASQQSRNNRTVRTILLTFSGLLIGVFGSWLWYEYKYVSCPIGERISGQCFRMITTSGEKERLFISNNNFDLVKGSEYFKQGKYGLAIKSFEQAIYADISDPVPQIYLSNAKARLQGNPLKIAVSVPVDYYENAAKEILRGVADAQNEFNNLGGKNGRLLEIVVANDGNEFPIARKIAEDLTNQKDILAVIGHQASETTQAALPIYQQKRLAIISSTSTSSKLQSDVFFRTVTSTKVAAQLYASYIKKNLNINKIVVFYAQNSLYSKTIFEDFNSAFNQLGGMTTSILLDGLPLDINKEIDNIRQQNIQAALLLNNVKASSITIAIAQRNFKLPTAQRLKLLAADAAFEDLTIKKGGNAVEGMTLVSLCLAGKSKYMIEAKKRWQQDINWRTATSYDATQALIEAINLSSNNPTREEILNNLKSVRLPISKTSGFGLEWSTENPLDHFNIKRKYCIYQIHNHKFEKVPEK